MIIGPHLAVRAEEENGPRRWEGTTQYCVVQSAFERPITAGCADGNYRGFLDINVGNNVTSYSYDLTCTDCPPASTAPLHSSPAPTPAVKEPWQQNIDWCKHNSE